MTSINVIIKERNSYHELQERCDEMSEHISGLNDDCRRQSEELRYFSEFISFKGLKEEFRYFRENAFEDPEDEMPFPRLII